MPVRDPIDKWWGWHQRGDFDEEAFVGRCVELMCNAGVDIIGTFSTFPDEYRVAFARHCDGLQQWWLMLIDLLDKEVAKQDMEEDTQSFYDPHKYRKKLEARVLATQAISDHIRSTRVENVNHP